MMPSTSLDRARTTAKLSTILTVVTFLRWNLMPKVNPVMVKGLVLRRLDAATGWGSPIAASCCPSGKIQSLVYESTSRFVRSSTSPRSLFSFSTRSHLFLLAHFLLCDSSGPFL